MALVDDLKAAKALIDTPEKWIKNELVSEDEACFCVYGAATFGPRNSWDSSPDNPVVDALLAQLPEKFSGAFKHRLAEFNDEPTTTHADIMALFDRAIERAALSTAESGK